MKGTPKNIFLTSSVAGGLYRSLNTSDSTLDIVYTARIVQSSERLTAVSLDPELKSTDSNQIMERCGDEYVAQINRGGMISINLKFEFGTVQNRTKWQSLLNLNVALTDLSKDLKSKAEKNSVDGTLTVSVHQIGGNPNQALMNVKSCSMSNASDLDACQKLVDEVVAYASQSFPSQVQSSPTVLNFVTVPMRNLGVRGLPDLDPKTLQIRKDLEVRLKDYAYLKSMADLARAMNLPYDGQLEGDIDFNQAVIKDTARVCYTYEWKRSTLSWQRCYDQYEKLTASLRRIERRKALIQRLVIPAADVKGESIVNAYSEKMSIVFALDPKALWNFGWSQDVVPSDGVDRNTGRRDSCSSNCLVPASNKGVLLMRQGSTFQVPGVGGSVEVFPGESVNFVMNDEKEKFSDNKGAITVYWRCLSCLDDAKERPTTRIVVPARLEAGVPFKNRLTGSATYSVIAYGQWTTSADRQWSDARGVPSECGSTCPAPKANDQVLVAKRSSKATEVIGIDGQLTLDPGETVTFAVNDDRGGYGDNIGEMELVLQCLNCP